MAIFALAERLPTPATLGHRNNYSHQHLWLLLPIVLDLRDIPIRCSEVHVMTAKQQIHFNCVTNVFGYLKGLKIKKNYEIGPDSVYFT